MATEAICTIWSSQEAWIQLSIAMGRRISTKETLLSQNFPLPTASQNPPWNLVPGILRGTEALGSSMRGRQENCIPQTEILPPTLMLHWIQVRLYTEIPARTYNKCVSSYLCFLHAIFLFILMAQKTIFGSLSINKWLPRADCWEDVSMPAIVVHFSKILVRLHREKELAAGTECDCNPPFLTTEYSCTFRNIDESNLTDAEQHQATLKNKTLKCGNKHD